MKTKVKPGRKADPRSKRSLGLDRHTLPRRAFHAPPELFEALAACIEATRPPPSESAVIRLALEEYLEKRGFWPPK